MDLSVTVNLGNFNQVIDSIARDKMPLAASIAVDRVALAAKDNMRAEMQSVFDRPTPFTLNSLFTKLSRNKNGIAYVGIKDESFKAQAPSRWLSPQVFGGVRPAKRFEERLRAAGILGPGQYAMPASGARLDGYGNMSRAQLVAILSDVQAHWDPAQRSTLASRQKRERRRTKRGGVYFAVTTRRGSLRPGIYERIGFGFGSAARPVLIFTDKAPTYRKRLDIERIAKETMQRRYSEELKRAIEEVVTREIAKRVAA